MGFWKKIFGGGSTKEEQTQEPVVTEEKAAVETTPASTPAPEPEAVAVEPAEEGATSAEAEVAAEEEPEPAEATATSEPVSSAPAPTAIVPVTEAETNGSVLVVAEVTDGALNTGSLSAVTVARNIAASDGVDFHIVVAGSGVESVGDDLAKYGAKSVLVVSNDGLDHYLAAPFGEALAGVARALGSSFVVGVASTFGKDLLPRIAVRLGAGMISEAIELRDKENGKHVFRRPMWAGNVLADVQATTAVTVVSVRGTDFDKAASVDDASPVEVQTPTLADTGAQSFVQFAKTESERPELTEASVVVAGGRGLKDSENFYEIMEPLADSMEAAIGASRAAVDAGFCPNDFQVGQTGKVVAPDLYVAVAISGAIQHLAGMKNSKTIVAINKDEEAPIFQIADYGLVTDAFKASPEFAEKVAGARQ